jgi:hypothetical protein
MRNLKKYFFPGVAMAVLCLGAFVTTSSAQWRHRGSGLRISFSIGSSYRSSYPRYYVPRRVYRPVYYTPAPVYYSSYGYSPGYYNSGYYAPAYNSGYYVTSYRRHRRHNSCNYYRRY